MTAVGTLKQLWDGIVWGKEAQVIINSALKFIRDASSTEDGLTRYATNAEALTASLTNVALVPANFSGRAALQTYVEGTFTPVLAFGGASVGITYTAQSGVYTRIGRLVHVEIVILLSSKGSSTGSATITGLPLTVAQSSAAQLQVNTMTAGVGDTFLQAAFTGAATTIALQDITAGAGTLAFLTDVDFANTSLVRVTGVYRTSA
jgi:hypothetical protein